MTGRRRAKQDGAAREAPAGAKSTSRPAASKWPMVRLGEVLALDLDPVRIDPSETDPMVGVLSFGKGLFDREPITNGKTSYTKFYRLKEDHVVMSQLFGWEGALALSSREFAGKYASPQFPTFLCNESKLDRFFLGWLMRLPAFWDDLGSRTSGMGDRRRTLNPAALLQTTIPLPPVPEQRRIVAKIGELAQGVEETRRLAKGAIEEAGALLRTFVFKDESAVPTALSDLVRLRPPDVSVEQANWYDFAGVYSFGRGLFRAQRRQGIEFSYVRLRRLRTGDFVYPKLMAWEGAYGIVPEECDGCVVSPEFCVFDVDRSKVLPEVLAVYFGTPEVWPRLSGLSTGTNVRRRRLHPDTLLAHSIPLPSHEKQMQLREIRENVLRMFEIRSSIAVELDALLPSILDRAFNGEL